VSAIPSFLVENAYFPKKGFNKALINKNILWYCWWYVVYISNN
jgi:hypothetical protein